MDTAVHEPRFDFEQIDGLVRTVHEHNAAWRDWFAAYDIRPHLVRYEELVADVAGVTRNTLDFLGLQPPADLRIEVRHSRQADEINREWIRRYRAGTG